MKRDKKPLYRKEKKTGLQTQYYVSRGGENRWHRNSKAAKREAEDEVAFLPHRGHNAYKSGNGLKQVALGDNLGMDYTPLFMFLLSKVGKNWEEVYAEAKSRLDREEPIFYMVQIPGNEFWDRREGKLHDTVNLGQSAAYHGLTVNDDGILVKVDPNAIPDAPSCTCHTHSFNGKPITPETMVRDWQTKLVGPWKNFIKSIKLQE